MREDRLAARQLVAENAANKATIGTRAPSPPRDEAAGSSFSERVERILDTRQARGTNSLNVHPEARDGHGAGEAMRMR